jgi:hypothetical protein
MIKPPDMNDEEVTLEETPRKPWYTNLKTLEKAKQDNIFDLFMKLEEEQCRLDAWRKCLGDNQFSSPVMPTEITMQCNNCPLQGTFVCAWCFHTEYFDTDVEYYAVDQDGDKNLICWHCIEYCKSIGVSVPIDER